LLVRNDSDFKEKKYLGFGCNPYAMKSRGWSILKDFLSPRYIFEEKKLISIIKKIND